MYALVIDGNEVRREETIKPLIEELTYYAQGTEFMRATIKWFNLSIAPACDHRAATAGLKWCAEMSCPNYVNKHQDEWTS